MAETHKGKIAVLMRADLIAAGINPDKYLGRRNLHPRKYARPRSKLTPTIPGWVCMICHKDYKYLGALMNHIKKYHPENIEGLPR